MTYPTRIDTESFYFLEGFRWVKSHRLDPDGVETTTVIFYYGTVNIKNRKQNEVDSIPR